jgi:hypothetical protein
MEFGKRLNVCTVDTARKTSVNLISIPIIILNQLSNKLVILADGSNAIQPIMQSTF